MSSMLFDVKSRSCRCELEVCCKFVLVSSNSVLGQFFVSFNLLVGNQNE